jgi:phosphate transport system substrate-binding protein
VKPGQLKLTGTVLADIYAGKVTKWNSPEISALNPGVTLPDAPIATVHRADGSGTSFIFTNYLSKVNADWKAKVGEGTAVNWPANGVGGKGNEGVAQYVLQLKNSIGYVEYAYAKQNKMDYVQMKNQAGNFVSPDDSTFKAAAAGADWSKTFYQVLTDEPGKDAWPITGATFVLLQKTQEKPAQGAAVMKFFDWAFTNGDKAAAELDYVSLPDALKAQIRKQWAEVKDSSGKTVAFK